MNAEIFHIKACHIETDPVLARLKRLPLRLRVAHLAALLRHERQAMARAHSYPSPRAAVGREGRSEAEARVGGLSALHDDPHPVAHFIRADPPRKGEGSTAPSGRQGRAG
jgi:hypothetical protein